MNRERFRTAFGAALDQQLRRRGLTQTTVAAAAGLAPSYLNRVMTGLKSASPAVVDRVTSAATITGADAVELHRAAARTAGYKLDLTSEDDAEEEERRPRKASVGGSSAPVGTTVKKR